MRQATITTKKHHDRIPLIGGVAGDAPAKGVAAYVPKAETCRDTSQLSEHSRVGGCSPSSIIHSHRSRNRCNGISCHLLWVCP